MQSETSTCIQSVFAILHFSSTFVIFVCLFHIFGRSLHTTLAKVLRSPPWNSSKETTFSGADVKLQLSYYLKTVRFLSAVLTSNILFRWMVSHFFLCFFFLGWYTWVFTPGFWCLLLFNTEFHSVHWHVFCECTVMYRTDNGIFSKFVLPFLRKGEKEVHMAWRI